MLNTKGTKGYLCAHQNCTSETLAVRPHGTAASPKCSGMQLIPGRHPVREVNCDQCESTAEGYNALGYQARMCCIPQRCLPGLLCSCAPHEALTRLGTEQLPLGFKLAPFSTTNRADVTPRVNTGRTRQDTFAWWLRHQLKKNQAYIAQDKDPQWGEQHRSQKGPPEA